MASSRATPSTALLLSLNLVFFTMVSSCPPSPPSTYCPPPPPPSTYFPPPPRSPSPPPPRSPSPPPPPPRSPSPPPPRRSPPPPRSPSPPPPRSPSPPPPPPRSPSPPPSPKPCQSCPPVKPSPVPSSNGGSVSCPKDAPKLGVCVDLLKDLLSVTVGTPPKTPCCSLIAGLVDLEAAVCLCTTIKASILGINLNIPVNLSLLLNYCGKQAPKNFQCA